MNNRLKTGLLLLIFFLSGCGSRITPASPGLPAEPTSIILPSGLTQEQFDTLGSLQKIDDHPLYSMIYAGAYRSSLETSLFETPFASNNQSAVWACSLFTVLLDKDNFLYGRNFDWQFSPTLLLFTDPPDGYASVSMVDIEYLGFDGSTAEAITALPVEERTALLDTPSIPFDGMNEYGLAIGMAAVPSGDMQPDPGKATIGSLGIIRQVLDHARTMDEAVELMKRYNIDFTGGPTLHYLIADAKGKSVLVEYHNGKMHALENKQPWHLATNFLLSSVDNPKDGDCRRYNFIDATLTETDGRIDPQAAMQLLADVAQSNTQWSVVYQMSSGEIDVVMGQQYQEIHRFQLETLIP